MWILPGVWTPLVCGTPVVYRTCRWGVLLEVLQPSLWPLSYAHRVAVGVLCASALAGVPTQCRGQCAIQVLPTGPRLSLEGLLGGLLHCGSSGCHPLAGHHCCLGWGTLASPLSLLTPPASEAPSWGAVGYMEGILTPLTARGSEHAAQELRVSECVCLRMST